MTILLGGINKMSGAIMNKVLDLFGVETEEDYEEDYEEENEQEEVEEENKNFWNRRSNKVVNMPQANQIKMVISQPTSFEQSESICDLLKEKKSVIVNLEYVNKDVARRIIDVISGAVHALDGHIQKVSNSIFLIAPYNYDITNEMAREEIKNKLSVSWLRNTQN
jgi:cell division inhibitor SepF